RDGYNFDFKKPPSAKEACQGIDPTVRSIINARTPLSLGCFYGVLFALLLAPLYPSISQANLGTYLSSGLISGIVGGHIAHFSGFTAFLGLEIYSSFYGLLFGRILAWLGGAVLLLTIETGTIDLAVCRPIIRTRD